MTTRTLVTVMGASGRMGVELQRALTHSPYARTSALVVRPGSALVNRPAQSPGLPAYTDDLHGAIASADVVVEFVGGPALIGVLNAAERSRRPVVCGSTGLGSEQTNALRSASKTIPVFYAANMSVGVSVMNDLIREATRKLGQGYDIEVVEAHHRNKVDAPSGTAKRLIQTRLDAGADKVAGHSLRGGDVIGDHTVHFLGVGDRIEITHRANTRQTFAQGALRAALWLRDQPPGLYGMKDMLESR